MSKKNQLKVLCGSHSDVTIITPGPSLLLVFKTDSTNQMTGFIGTYRAISQSCEPGRYYDKTKGCLKCQEGMFSQGGSADNCILCPEGQTVDEGVGKCLEDCYWSKKH